MTTGIYKITNLVNSKVYIGASKNVEKRWSNHRRSVKSPIHSDLETYGLENFKFEILLECPEDMLAQWERDMICLCDADDPERGYNSRDDRPYSLKMSETLKGRKLSDEVRRKLSKAHKEVRSKGFTGCKHTEESRHRMSEAHKGQKAWNKGLKASNEAKRKMSEAQKGHKGCKFTDETKRKMSEARKEYWRKKKELNGLKIHSNNEKQNK